MKKEKAFNESGDCKDILQSKEAIFLPPHSVEISDISERELRTIALREAVKLYENVTPVIGVNRSTMAIAVAESLLEFLKGGDEDGGTSDQAEAYTL